MRFSKLINAAIQFLQDSERATYRALQREFDLDQDTLEDLKNELLEARKVAVDEGGRVLVWRTGGVGADLKLTRISRLCRKLNDQFDSRVFQTPSVT